MLIKFYVNGVVVETYKCQAKAKHASDGLYFKGLTNEDIHEVSRIKQDVYRNYGYPPIIEVEVEE